MNTMVPWSPESCETINLHLPHLNSSIHPIFGQISDELQFFRSSTCSPGWYKWGLETAQSLRFPLSLTGRFGRLGCLGFGRLVRSPLSLQRLAEEWIQLVDTGLTKSGFKRFGTPKIYKNCIFSRAWRDRKWYRNGSEFPFNLLFKDLQLLFHTHFNESLRYRYIIDTQDLSSSEIRWL